MYYCMAHTIYWTGVQQEERRQSRVALVIKNELVNKMTKTSKFISGRIITLRPPLAHDRFVTLIIAYAPTMSNPEPIKEEFYQKLSEIVRRVPESDKLVILGNFHAKIVRDHRTYGPALGQFDKGNCNANGELLICTQHDLIMTNTYFNQPDCYYYTWRHSRSKHYYLLDYVIVKKAHKADVIDTKAMGGAECGKMHRSAPKPSKKLNVQLLKNPNIKANLQQKLLKRLQETNHYEIMKKD